MTSCKVRLSFDVTFEGIDEIPTDTQLKDVSVDFDEIDAAIITRGRVTIERFVEAKRERDGNG